MYQMLLGFALLAGVCLVGILFNSDFGPLSNRLAVAGGMLWLFALAGIGFATCFGLPWLVGRAISRYRRREGSP